MVKQTCPHDDQLASFVRCELSEEVAADVLDHLDHCPHCEETVAKLEMTIKSVLPGAAPTMISMPYAEESACQRAVRTLVNEFTAAAPEASPVIDTNPPASSDEQAVFQTLRDFRIVEKVGQGGMGAVYKAVHQRMQRTVALKVLPSGMIGDQSAIARFNREMSVLGQLNHPNIVQAFDAGDHDGQHYLAMEFIEGEDLATVLRKHRRLNIPDACLAVCQVASALQYAHEKGFVHRDIKPSNLMLAEVVGADGKPQAIVKVLDLGLARVFEQTIVDHDKPTAELTSAGQIMGTLDYMAPEQGTDSHHVDIRTDIYSLGATLYKLLTGETPFAEHATKPPMQRLMAMATLEVPRVSSKRPEIPEKLAAVVHRMLEKDPARRFQTPVELLRALEEFTTGANLLALMRPDTATAAASEQSSPSTKSLPLPSASRHGGNRGVRRSLAMLGGFSAFVLLSAILVLTTRHGRIEVTSPDGTLPADLKVAVSNGGDSVEILQADNQWSAKVVNGEYQLQLTGGDDKFEIKESKLTVSRMGKAIVFVELRKADAIAAKTPPGPDVSKARSGMSDSKAAIPSTTLEMKKGQSVAAATSGKPFRLLRHGVLVRDFATLPGALAELDSGDIIEILSNDRLVIRTPEPITKPLHLRAGEGFRPLLDFPGQGVLEIQSDFTVEGCDLDWRDSPQRNSDHHGIWKIRNCRYWGYLLASCKSISFENSILVGSHTCITFSRSCTDATFDNCLIRYADSFMAAPESPKLHLKLNNCSFCMFGHGIGGLVHEWGPTLGGETQLTVEATGNVFNGNLATGQWIPKSSQSKVHWTGKENLFCGRWYEEWEPDGDTWKLARSGLNTWNSWLKTPETGSRELPALALEMGRVQSLNGPEFVEGVKQQVEKIKHQHQLTDVGPDWDIVGPGNAYVRALAADGKPVAEADLRPERLETGPIVLLHTGAEPRGFLTLKEALDAAANNDVIEFRTDDSIPGVIWNGQNRVLTLRAAPGYSPMVDGELSSIGTDRLIVEGLTLRLSLFASGSWMGDYDSENGGKVIYPNHGSIIRIANCQVLGIMNISGWFNTGTDAIPEVVNCIAPNLQVGLRSAGTVKIRNSVFQHMWASMETASATRGTVDCDHCAFWRVTAETLHDHGKAVYAATPVTFEMEHSLFAAVAPFQFNPADDAHPPVWTGNHNTYICRNTTEAFRLKQSLQEKFQSDADSVELLPWEFDPAQWRILPDATPGYEPRPDGTDFGARIDELIEAMK